jgi:hypothetical protein
MTIFGVNRFGFHLSHFSQNRVEVGYPGNHDTTSFSGGIKNGSTLSRLKYNTHQANRTKPRGGGAKNNAEANTSNHVDRNLP